MEEEVEDVDGPEGVSREEPAYLFHQGGSGAKGASSSTREAGMRKEYLGSFI